MENILQLELQKTHKVYLFEKDNGTPIWTRGMMDVCSIAISANGEYIMVAGSEDKIEYIYLTRIVIHRFGVTNTGGAVYSVGVAISADGSFNCGWFYWIIRWRYFYLFDKNSSTPLWTFDAERDGPVSIDSISADGRYVASITYGSFNGSILSI